MNCEKDKKYTITLDEIDNILINDIGYMYYHEEGKQECINLNHTKKQNKKRLSLDQPKCNGYVFS
jgi:hypothetical protein